MEDRLDDESTDEARLQELDRCVSLYRTLELPLPPDDAVLVRFDPAVNTSQGPAIGCGYRVGRTRNGRASIWTGDGSKFRVEVGKPILSSDASNRVDDISFDRLSPVGGFLTLAIVERIRGNDTLALKAFDCAIEEGVWPTRWHFESTPILKTAFLALHRYARELVTPGSDRAETLRKLRRIVELAPALKTSAVPRLIRQVEANVVGKGAGNPWIDALCESVERGTTIEACSRRQYAALKPIQAIVDQGFALVPALIAHLDDERLTRAVDPAFNNKPETLWTVGQTCRAILCQFRGKAEVWDRTTPKRWRKWWAAVHEKGERAYCLSALEIAEGFPSEVLLRIARKRFPEVLVESFNAVVDQPGLVQVHPYLSAMEESKLSRATIIAAALRATESRHLDQVHSGLWTLYSLDLSAFDRELTRVLDAIPANARGGWLSREASFAQQATYSDSPAVWGALLAATQRVDQTLRGQIIETVFRGEFEESVSQKIVAFLLSFFDSKEVIESIDGYARPQSGDRAFSLAQIVIVHTALRLRLELPNDPSIDRGEYRERIRSAAQEFIRPA